MAQTREKWEALRASVLARNAPREPSPRPAFDRTAIVLGFNQDKVPVVLPEITRLQHAHVIGSIGSGKSSFLEHCIRQDILKGRGVCVIDPHGNHPDGLYRKLLTWMHAEGFTKGGRRERVIHLVDPNAPGYTVGFNPLALPTAATRPEVISNVVLEAFERVWGDEDTHAKPTIRRVLKATFTALAELGLTLAEAEFLYDPYDTHDVRQLILSRVKDRYARAVINDLHQIAMEDRTKSGFRAEVVGPINRISEFVSNEAIRTIIGQKKRTLDIGAALDGGHIILANLSGGDYVEAADAELLGRLLVRMFFFHAKRRHQQPITPYWLYLDECQLYLSGNIQKMLAEVRKFGLGVMLSHQFMSQLGEPNDELRAAVRNSTKLKAVFNIADHVDAEELAQSVMTLNLEQPVKASMRPTVVGHQRVKLASESISEQQSVTEMRTDMKGESVGRTVSYSESAGESFAEGESSAKSEAESASEAASSMIASGSAAGTMSAEMMLPATGWLASPDVVGMSEGASAITHNSQASGVSSTTGHTSGRSSGTSSMHAVTSASAWGESISRAKQSATSIGQAASRGQARTQGTSEAFESIYMLLPSSFHSKENALYMAAQMLRCLNTGLAYVRYFDRMGARETFLAVPRVTECVIADDEFGALRDRVLAESPSASPTDQARERVAAREQAVINAAREASVPPEPSAPADFRVKKSRPAPEPKSPAEFRTKKTRPAKEEKGKE
jgi:hypothetical protein